MLLLLLPPLFWLLVFWRLLLRLCWQVAAAAVGIVPCCFFRRLSTQGISTNRITRCALCGSSMAYGRTITITITSSKSSSSSRRTSALQQQRLLLIPAGACCSRSSCACGLVVRQAGACDSRRCCRRQRQPRCQCPNTAGLSKV